jgi:tRNA A-37 threonylcarbamoyl transferase component Bud32
MHAAEHGQVLSSDRNAMVVRLEGDPPLLLKWRRPRPGRRRRTWLRASRERKEARATLALRTFGVEAVRPFAIGERRRLGLLVGAVSIRPFVTDASDLRAVGQADPALLIDAGRTLRAWHELGFRHGDLYPKNVLRLADGSPIPIGYPAARFRLAGPTLDARRLRDLAQWAAGIWELHPDIDVHAFLEPYAEQPGVGEPEHLRALVRRPYERIREKKRIRAETRAAREARGPLVPEALPLPGPTPPRIREFPMSALGS